VGVGRVRRGRRREPGVGYRRPGRLSARTLQRRCHARFGYGPQHLVRVLRLQGALALHRSVWAEVAADAG
jgi:hypothetical protein